MCTPNVFSFMSASGKHTRFSQIQQGKLKQEQKHLGNLIAAQRIDESSLCLYTKFKNSTASIFRLGVFFLSLSKYKYHEYIFFFLLRFINKMFHFLFFSFFFSSIFCLNFTLQKCLVQIYGIADYLIRHLFSQKCVCFISIFIHAGLQ